MVERELDHFIDPSLVESELFQIEPEDYDEMKDIPKQIMDAVCDYYNSGKWRTHNLIINSFAGSGKSFVISKFLASIKNPESNPFVYMTLNHQVSSEFISNYISNGGKECYPIIGKGAVDKDTNEPLSCMDEKGFAIVKKYGKNGWYCKDGICPKYPTCQHQNMIKNMMNQNYAPSFSGHFLLYPTLYQNVVLKKFFRENYILVFDEDMSNSFCVHETLFRPALLEAIRLIDILEVRDLFEQLVEGWDKFNSYPITDKEMRRSIEIEYTQLLYDSLLLINRDLLELAKNNYEDEIESNYGTKREVEFKNPLDFMCELKDFVDMYSRHMKKELPMTFITYSRVSISVDYFRTIKERTGVIILNATFERDICEKLFPPSTKWISTNIKQPLKKYQKIYRIANNGINDRYATYGYGSLVYKGNLTDKFEELAFTTKLFADNHNKTIVFCVNKIYPYLEDILYNKFKLNRENVKLDTYAWAVGKNEYEKFDGCVIFGTPYHNVNHFEKKRDLYNVNDEIMFRNETINLMIQAINRIRPLSWKDEQHQCEICLLTSINIEKYLTLEDGYQTEIMSLRNMRIHFNNDYIPKKAAPILTFIKEHELITKKELMVLSKMSHHTLEKYIEILKKKMFIFEEESKKKGKGRPDKIYGTYSSEYRGDYLTLEKMKWDFKADDLE